METVKAIFDALVNTAPGRLLILAIVLGFVTQGLKGISAPKGTLRAALLPAIPVFIGAPLGLIPGLLPGVDIVTAVLLCALAGVACAWLFYVISRVADHLQERAVTAATNKIDDVLPAPKEPPKPT